MILTPGGLGQSKMIGQLVKTLMDGRPSLRHLAAQWMTIKSIVRLMAFLLDSSILDIISIDFELPQSTMRAATHWAQAPRLVSQATRPSNCVQLARYSTRAQSKENQTLKLPDGRVMGFSEFGDPSGRPLLYFHGYPSSRLEGTGMDHVARKTNLRVFTLERPGFGISTPQPGRRVIDYVHDVKAFTDYMGFGRVAIMGGSGGGPYALACAHSLPRSMLSAVGLFASGGPYDKSWEGIPLRSRLGYLTAKYAPRALGATGSAIVGTAKWAIRGPGAKRFDAMLAKERQTSENPPSGMTVEEAREEAIRTMFEGFAQGSGAFVEEAIVLSVRHWGFELEETDFPIQIWHGEKDTNAPIQWIRNMSKRLPNSRLKEYPGESHYTMVNHLEGILAEFMPMGSGQAASE